MMRSTRLSLRTIRFGIPRRSRWWTGRSRFTIARTRTEAHWHLTDVGVITQRFNDLFGLDLKAYRKYWGIEVLFNKRFSNKWQMVASYVYSVTKGTMGNSSAYRDIGWNSYGDPNFWINADGHVTNDPTHMVKVQASYVLPFDISLNAYFHAITGEAYTQQLRTGSHDFSQGRITFNVEPSGKYHYPIATSLDLRLEKTFTLSSKYRLGAFVDVFNVFNDASITSWGTRVDYDWIAVTAPERSPLFSIDIGPRPSRDGPAEAGEARSPLHVLTHELQQTL